MLVLLLMIFQSSCSAAAAAASSSSSSSSASRFQIVLNLDLNCRFLAKEIVHNAEEEKSQLCYVSFVILKCGDYYSVVERLWELSKVQTFLMLVAEALILHLDHGWGNMN